MTAAERKVRAAYQPYGSPSCERTAAQWARGDGFRVLCWIEGERKAIGYGATRASAWTDAASRLPALENAPGESQ